MTLVTAPQLDLDTLAARFERWSARDIVAWAVGTFGGRLAVTASMADTVLVHLATTVDPDVEVVFLDTGFHFAETISTLRRAQSKYRLNLRVEDGGAGVAVLHATVIAPLAPVGLEQVLGVREEFGVAMHGRRKCIERAAWRPGPPTPRGPSGSVMAILP